jgi:signal transduction histidine kinase/CheY-like chemotaxis protein
MLVPTPSPSGPNGPKPSRNPLSVSTYALLALSVWTAALGASLAWNLHLERSAIHDVMLHTARAYFDKDLTYRSWVAQHGGVYVPVTPETPPNAYLAGLPERDLTTTAGKHLTLMNPAYMVRQVYQISAERAGVQGHMTSLRPIQPENRPDEWEQVALKRLERGEEHVDSVEVFRGEPHLRYMRRLLVENSCLNCHESQGYKLGDVRGGISVSLPLAPYLAIERRQTSSLEAAHVGIWLLGVAGIVLAQRRFRHRVKERQREEQEHRSLEQQLHHARRIDSVGRLTGGIAHDLNNLLSPILGLSSIVLEELRPQDPLRSDVEEIRQSALRARELTHRLLAFSRKQELQVGSVEVFEMVGGMRKMLAAMLGEDVELVIEVPRALPPIRADRAQLELALLNLAINARDAMPRGGALRITARPEQLEGETAARELIPGRYVELTLSDTGIGMDEGTLDRMFEPFFTTKAAGKGTGLGLATVHGVVKQHGGAIDVQSAIGRGTTVRLILPVAEGAAHALPERSHGLPPRGTETVLLVEDDPPVRDFVRRVLEGLGYQVVEADGPHEALRLVERAGARVDLLVTDVIMPHMSGPDLARQLSGRWPGLAVLFISGNPRDALGPPMTGTAPLWKPFTPLELARAVRRSIDVAVGTCLYTDA